MRAFMLALLGTALSACAGEPRHITQIMEYSGLSDASAAVAVSSNRFIVASDNDNSLHLYSTERGSPPLEEFDCSTFLNQSDEADLEGAARIGERIFWIGSHARNHSGKDRPSRHCFFATDIVQTSGKIKLVPTGQPYRFLLQDLVRDPRLAPFQLGAGAEQAPKQSGALNIEGLAASPEGHLLIGFRNPVPQGLALIVPLLNPNEVIVGTHARLGPPILLDLGTRGIRDLACQDGSYFIIAGSYHGGGKFRLYQWGGPGSEPARLQVKHLDDFHPEAIVLYPDLGRRKIQILSDDGKRPVAGIRSNRINDPLQRTFRSFWISLNPN